MKIRTAYSRLRAARGFTLMEILVVMVIIVVLATLTISIYTWLETRKNEQAAESIVRKIERGLSSYHNDHDRYPYGTEAPFRNHGAAVADGEEFSSNVVYMALFGDYKNEGAPARDATIYNDEMNPGTQPKSNPLVRQITVTKAGQQVPLYILTDPWGSPYRYRLGSEQALPTKSASAKNLKMGTGQNPDYDFWSFGKDGDSDLRDPRAPENQDDIGNLPKF